MLGETDKPGLLVVCQGLPLNEVNPSAATWWERIVAATRDRHTLHLVCLTRRPVHLEQWRRLRHVADTVNLVPAGWLAGRSLRATVGTLLEQTKVAHAVCNEDRAWRDVTSAGRACGITLVALDPAQLDSAAQSEPMSALHTPLRRAA